MVWMDLVCSNKDVHNGHRKWKKNDSFGRLKRSTLFLDRQICYVPVEKEAANMEDVLFCKLVITVVVINVVLQIIRR